MLSVDGQGQSRILSVGTAADVTISGLTLADGRASTGGGIINRGKLALTDCTLSGNTATAFGGGLYNIGTLTMIGCTLSGNTATVLGGGLYSKYFPIGSDFGTAALTDCTVSGNTAPSSAGLSLAYGTNTLVNCTVSANTATASQRGLAAGLNSFGAMTLENTIVAGNTGPSGASDLGGRGTASASNSLVGTGSVTGSHDQLGVTKPMLGPLAWNGGPTRTMALLPGSPAIGKGTAIAGVTTDQRGLPLDSPAADIGAFQYQGPPPTVKISGPTTETVQVQATFTLTATDPTPADRMRDVHLHDRLERRWQRHPDDPGAGLVAGCACLPRRGLVHPECDRARPGQPQQRAEPSGGRSS